MPDSCLVTRCVLALVMYAEFAEKEDSSVQEYAAELQADSGAEARNLGRALIKGHLSRQRGKRLAEYTMATYFGMMLLLCVVFASLGRKQSTTSGSWKQFRG